MSSLEFIAIVSIIFLGIAIIMNFFEGDKNYDN